MVVNWIILDEAHMATMARAPRLPQAAHWAALAGAQPARSLEARRAHCVPGSAARKLSAPRRCIERFGFEVVGERPRYYKDNNEDALLMTLERMQVDKLKALETTVRVSASQFYSGER